MRAVRIYEYGVRTRRLRFRVWSGALLVFAICCLVGGGYLLFLLMSPRLTMAAVNSSWNVPVAHSPEKAQESRLYIPRLKLNLPYAAGDESVLNDAIWHRYPERGDPERGGNFILAGHRFEMGLTPGETRHKSPLYHIDKLQKDDFLYVDFKGKRYAYKVIERLTVAPNQTAIEAASTEPKLTLYTCTFKGASDGREVILAQLVERDIPLDQEL